MLYARYVLGILWAWMHFIMNNEPPGLGTTIMYVRVAPPHSQPTATVRDADAVQDREERCFTSREGAVRHPKMTRQNAIRQC